jgi:L,D-transpeptidase YcbB
MARTVLAAMKIALLAVSVALGVFAGTWVAVAQTGRNDTVAQADDSNTSDEFKQRRAEKQRQEEILLEGMLSQHVLVSPEAETAMQSAIQRYQQIVAAGGWPRLQKTRTLRIGDLDEVVPLIRAQLQITDGLDPSGATEWSFDESVQKALMAFQRRHGIPPNGVYDARTFAALSVPAEARLQQLRVNQLRMRDLLDRKLPARYVMVNVPGFELQAVSNGVVEISSRVIAGRPERQTPAIAAKINGVNFFPFWNVPESVAFKDLVPKAQKDPAFLINERIRVLTDWNGQEIDPRSVDWGQPEYLNIKFKQDPGPQNALGLVRIDMPNPDNVYMHDTPMKQLFGQSRRAFSAGCVRIHKIFDLVTWIVATNGDWDRARVDSALLGGQPIDVKLNAPIDVFFTYLTAWTDADGTPHFRTDLYDRDAAGDGMQAVAHDASDAPVVQSLAP